jgi:DNA-binding NarL/FixJ family response regulator
VAEAGPQASVRVLLVDDNQAILKRAAAILSRGCDVVGAVTDGPTALIAAAALRPDVIVLDVSMPGMTGFEVASRLRDAGSNAVLVFLTVHDEEEFLIAARAAGGIGYVTKLRIATDLLIAVREARAGRSFVSKGVDDRAAERDKGR